MSLNKDPIIQRIKEARLRKLEAEASSAELDLARERRMAADAESCLNYNQIYHFFEPVTYGGVEDAINWTGMWSRRNPGSDITIVFNSPGGGVFPGFALFDHIQALRAKGHKVITEARGMVASMGTILLQAGDERVVGPNAHVMIHEVSAQALGKTSELEDTVQLVNRLQDKALDALGERSTMTKRQIKAKWKRKDWWLDAEEAVELGFADRIG
jgi:ATP-dependent Clp endopeptidase proteolytic subunit ClpP